MTRRHSLRSTIAIAPIGAMLLLAACARDTQGTANEATAPAGLIETDVVELTDTAAGHSGLTIEPVQTQTRSDRLVAPGLLALDDTRTSRIGSLQEGLVLETRAQVGDRVRARQLLATMHGHALHDAWAGYRKAIADVRRLEKELGYAVAVHERAQRLHADKAVSLQELQRAEVDRASATQLLVMARAEVLRSIEELEHVGVIVTENGEEVRQPLDGDPGEQIPVRSPIGGVVLERLVTPGTTVTPGMPLFTVSDLTSLWAVAEIDESHLSRVRTGRPVDIVVAAYPDEHFPGTITQIGDTVNPETRRVTVRSTVANPDGRLKPEMFATVTLGESDSRAMTMVPRSAVQTLDGRTAVFVAESSSRFRLRTVTLGSEVDGLVEVMEGLNAGEQIVSAGSFVLKSELLKRTAEAGE
jgi:cobalt-zinc-cadmium efflux system membrane fusion protein